MLVCNRNENHRQPYNYLANVPQAQDTPKGLCAAILSSEGLSPGAIFVLKNIHQNAETCTQNRIHPFYLVYVSDDEERYQFTWPDKKKAMLEANTPINKTLRPVVEDSVGKDGSPGGFDSENLYIEGDNLDVLKLLRETYLGKIKMIYIDPPYNTGNDFIYDDDFSIESDQWSEVSGQVSEEGFRMVQNTESNGRFHTDWLNMMYPRLKTRQGFIER